MMTRFLNSTTAILVALSVATPAPLMAQNAPTQEELKKQLEQAGEKAEEAVKGAGTKRKAEAQAEAEPGDSDRPQKPKQQERAAEAEPGDSDRPEKPKKQKQAAEAAPAEAPREEPKPKAAEAAPAEAPQEEPKPQAAEAEPGDADRTEEPRREAAEAAPAPGDADRVEEPRREAAETQAAPAEAEPRAAEAAPGDADRTEEPRREAAPAEAEPAPGDADRVAEELRRAEGERAEPAPGDADRPEQAEARAEPSREVLSGEAPKTAAAAAGSGEGKLVEETVTEETARRSSEEFRTRVDEQARPRQRERDGDRVRDRERTAAREDGNDSGLSTVEKIGILGLGALAVGTLLNNNQRVVSNSGDRVVIDDNGTYRVLKNDDMLLRQPGADVKTYEFQDGSTRTVVTYEDGTQVETVRAYDGQVLSRTRVLPDGRSVTLFDDTRNYERVAVNELPQVTDTRRETSYSSDSDEAALRDALQARLARDPGRSFSLAQVRNIREVRSLAPEVEVNNVNFDTGSAVIRPEEAEALAALGSAMKSAIEDNPAEVFLVEGHTDAIGGAGYNLALSDRRAESLALALTEYFNVPPENMVVQGYGESDLKVMTAEAERANRRAAVRRITPLLDGQG
ncbi:OmpA family protein [Pseudooceanicola sp. LIPI14-2-Ac024]|uniref:OmpA family protein n=1 Tax=Pseudooceanicola sp. LIPI14-2-Ac024 TaxID=3344875 RepID=UPI0035D0E752